MESNGRYVLPVVNIQLNMDVPMIGKNPICTSADAIAMVANNISKSAREMSYVICLDKANVPICVSRIGYGDADGAELSARDVAQVALLANAKKIFLIHNHPHKYEDTRALKPSKMDIEVTDACIKACGMFQIIVLDSIITGGVRDAHGRAYYHSMRLGKEKAVFRQYKSTYASAFALADNVSKIVWDNNSFIENYWGKEMRKPLPKHIDMVFEPDKLDKLE